MISQRPRNEGGRWSNDDFDSINDSEELTDSVIQLPRLAVSPVGGVNDASPASKDAPPPLPPKPSFARAGTIQTSSSPPPLPPKPDKISELPTRTRLVNATGGAGLQDLVFVSHPNVGPLSPPTRPLPAIPRRLRGPSYEEEGSWVPSILDDRSFLDPPFPPDPTVVSDGDTIRPTVKEGWDASTLSVSDHLPNLKLPLPPPPFAVANHALASRFFPLHASDSKREDGAYEILRLSTESAEDANIGAIVFSRTRLKDAHIHHVTRSAPIPWRLYKSAQPSNEVWNVLRDYLTNVLLKSHGRARALQLLTGYVVAACLESTDVGTGMLTEIVRRMRGAERSERDGSVFTLLINIAAHVSFVQRVSWHSVEQVTRKVFSDVVEEMHGRQDDKVMWERALRCFFVLFKSSDHYPSDDISTKCIVALALHIGDLTHADVDHVLITNGLCPRLRRLRDEVYESVSVDRRILEQIGGLDVIASLFVDTTSMSARHVLFGIIFEIAVTSVVNAIMTEVDDGVKAHIRAFRSFLEACDMADLLVHTFRVGPWPTFVLDVLRMLLFKPLTFESFTSSADSEDMEPHIANRAAFQEGTESVAKAHLSDDFATTYRAAASKYRTSVRAMVQCLDKSLCLQTLQEIERMAIHQAAILSRRETMHYPREWKLLHDLDVEVQNILYSRELKPPSLDNLLLEMYSVAEKMTSVRSSLRGIVKLMELLIEFFTMKMPFSSYSMPFGFESSVDCVSKHFLRGQIVAMRDLVCKSNPQLFSLLLVASRQRVPSKRVSEARQCLVEFLGASKEWVIHLKEFFNDDDAAVAYRASELVSKYSDQTTHFRNRSITVFDENN